MADDAFVSVVGSSKVGKYFSAVKVCSWAIQLPDFLKWRPPMNRSLPHLEVTGVKSCILVKQRLGLELRLVNNC